MRNYANKNELIAAIKETFDRFDEEFVAIPDELKHNPVDPEEKTPSQMLAYQLGWTSLLLQWEKDESAGLTVITPTADFKWNQLGDLYRSFYAQFAPLSIDDARHQLRQQTDAICDWLAQLSDTELFEPHHRKWATTQANWPVWKWIHINTVAPFTNFRPKIRRWKKIMLTH